MTVKDMKALMADLADDVEIEINSVFDTNENCLKPSGISEAHYHKDDNKVYLTPEMISI